MLLDVDNARYLAAVAENFQSGKLSPNATCAKCGVSFEHRLPAGENGDHLMIERTAGDPMTGTGELLMVIGCEGYWHVNPEAVGLPRGGWMAVTDQIGLPDDGNGHTDLNII